MSKTTSAHARSISRSGYKFSMEKRWLTMPDGVRLAATIYMPRAKRRGETFPVLLEILPYRKDDTFYLMDYPTYSYLAKHGIMVVKVDIRGTGASDGAVPPREYSDIELADAEEIIGQLAKLPESNGNVAMWGVSWSGFNSLMVAMRRPPALKTIISIHASDDLFHDDVHYVDGVLHMDPYHLFINHELALPRTPSYEVESDYIASRFNARPWVFTYLSQQRDGNFWRSRSLREDYGAINIPVYLIGGLLDGYRSAMVRIFENLKVAVKVDVGPWHHSCPDDGSPGPNYEYLDRVIRWLDYWLCGVKNGTDKELARGKEMLLFVRGGHRPDANMETTPGHWRRFAWPVAGLTEKVLHLRAERKLAPRKGRAAVDTLAYSAGTGMAAGQWWGDPTGDLSADDAKSLVYDSAPVAEPCQIVGFPQVALKVESTARQAVWSLRLEDVAPDGKVQLVTGALVNSSQRESRLAPSPVVPGEPYTISAQLHFTTWTFKPGHRIRLAVANAQFPIAWPNASALTGSVHVGRGESTLRLPVVPAGAGRKTRLPKVAERLDCPHGEGLSVRGDKPEAARYWTVNQGDGTTTYFFETRSAYRIRGRRFDVEGVNTWTTNEAKPWQSQYLGKMTTAIKSRRQALVLATTIDVRSDKRYFHVTFIRVLTENGRLVKRKTWRQSIPRQYQ